MIYFRNTIIDGVSVSKINLGNLKTNYAVCALISEFCSRSVGFLRLNLTQKQNKLKYCWIEELNGREQI